MRGACEIVESDTPGDVREKLWRALTRLDLSAEKIGPCLLRLLGLTEGTDALDGLGPETIQARIRDAFVQFVQASGRSRPLVLFVEDLHWVGRSFEECIAALVEKLPGSSLLLVTTTRPGYSAPWTGKSYAAQLPLPVLSPEASRQIVAATIRRTERMESATESILQKAEGNPLFLEELTLALEAQTGSSAQVLPDTIQGVLAARIDRLPEAAKRVLQMASVLGRAFPLRLLEAVAQTQTALQEQLAALTQLELLYERAQGQMPVYTFKHALIQEVAYDSLLGGPRAALHEAAGHALELLYPDRREKHYELLAHHFSHSANKEKALDYLELANRKAIKANAVFDAKNYFEQAMRILDALEDSDAHRHRRVALIAAQVDVFILTNQLDQYEAWLERFAPVAASLSDQGVRGPS